MQKLLHVCVFIITHKLLDSVYNIVSFLLLLTLQVNLVLIIISMTSLARKKFGMPKQLEQKPKVDTIVAR